MNASEAVSLSEKAYSEEEFDHQMSAMYEKIRKAAQEGRRDCILTFPFKLGSHAGKPLHEIICPESLQEKVRSELIRKGYRIETKRKYSGGVLQDPSEYICW